jgi:UPF0176 protein
MGASKMTIEVRAFYKFAALSNHANLKARLRELCGDHAIRGTILLAPEGINGTIAGNAEDLSAIMDMLRSLEGFADLTWKSSFAHEMPFGRMKVRIKKEIVTMGVPGIDPTLRVGRYIDASEWNAVISDPEVLVIDTRNAFEVAAGSFAGAIDPGTTSFGEFPAFVRQKLGNAKHRKIALFCTGGIRCEKATSFLLGEGFSDVCHLNGGILKYLEEVPAGQSLWKGHCFVFDERAGLGHGLEPLAAANDQPS